MCHTHPSNIISCDKNEMLTLKSIDVPYVLDTSINFSIIQLIVVAVVVVDPHEQPHAPTAHNQTVRIGLHFVFAFYLLPPIYTHTLTY